MASMLIASCRKHFWSPTEFSTVDEFRRIDLTTGTGATVPHADVLNELSNKRVMLLIHGYNNEELDVLKAYRTIDTEMRLLAFFGTAAAPYDAIVGYAWPGGAVGASFPFARLRAADSAPRFARLLSALRSTGASIDINSHSLGAHVMLEALRDGAPHMVRNAWTFAPAVDNESIEFNERYFWSSQRCQAFYIFHSKNDPVLRVWYRVGDLLDFDTALGYSGPEDPAAIMTRSPNVRVVNCKDVVTSHGGYRASGQVWAYMSQELATRSAAQFVTLTRTAAAMTAVFRSAMGLPTAPRARTPRRATATRRPRPRGAARR
jgi:esterase/lipase superfamily enzyme